MYFERLLVEEEGFSVTLGVGCGVDAGIGMEDGFLRYCFNLLSIVGKTQN